jgi:hypothetical protein
MLLGGTLSYLQANLMSCKHLMKALSNACNRLALLHSDFFNYLQQLAKSSNNSMLPGL